MLTRSVLRLPVLVLVGCGCPTLAASFDCAKAFTPHEKAICADPKLSQLDDDVAACKAQRAQLWILDARKSEIDFPEYSVAPRVAGLISVELTSDELKPDLARAFDPASLPRPIPAQPQ